MKGTGAVFSSLHGACQERGDLRAGAGTGGVEMTVAHAGGNAVFHGPRGLHPAVQRQRVADNFPGSDAYYNYVLTLFGQGWDQHRFRFSTKGELLPDWGQECANSH